MTIENIRKDDLITLILANTDEYKKTHLVEMKKDKVFAIATPFLPAEGTTEPKGVNSETEQAAKEPEAPAHDETPEAKETPQAKPTDVTDSEKDGTGEPAPQEKASADPSVIQMVEAAYAENEKKVKGNRLDKDEFRKTAIEKTVAGLTGSETEAEIRAAVVQTITTLLTDKSAFIPINETEKTMLATLPIMDGFKGTDSAIVGKDWLDKVEAEHSIPSSSTRALIVSLKKKKYISVKGRNSGEKVTKVQLMERGIQYLMQNGLLPQDKLSA